MILRRWGFILFATGFGASMAYLFLQLLGQRMLVPEGPAIILFLMALILSFTLAHLVAPKMFPIDSSAVIRPEIPRQNWAWLRPRKGGGRTSFPLNRDYICIGREVHCEIMLNDGSVSREHSAISRLAEGYLLRDLGSSNGTFVNGQRIQEVLLQDGDQVSIGDIEFTFEAGGGSPAGVSSAADNPVRLGGGLSLDPSAMTSLPLPEPDDDEEATETWQQPRM